MNNLYRVTLQGMRTAPIGVAHGMPYVVADNPTEAYNKVKKYLDDNDIGFRSDRELKSIELLASEEKYSDCGYQLFL